MSRSRVVLALVGVTACSGGQKPADPPGVRGDTCYWSGHVTATIERVSGDAACFDGRSLDVQLHGGWAPGELRVSAERPPVATAGDGNGFEVRVEGDGTLESDSTACRTGVEIRYPAETEGRGSTLIKVHAEQDSSTRRVTGRGVAMRLCVEDTCHCEAEVRFDGAIAVGF